MSKAKPILWHILGVVVALLGSWIAEFLARLLFLGLIPQIPFIPALLSWPVDYQWYALTGVVMAAYAVPAMICIFFNNRADTYTNYCLIIVSILNAIMCITNCVLSFSSGFSGSCIVYIFGLVTVGVGYAIGKSNS